MKPLRLLTPHLPDTFGTASFMSKLETMQLRLNERGEGRTLCPYVGSIADSSAPGEEPAMIYARSASSNQDNRDFELKDGSGNILSVAPTRAGKGVGQIIPNLLGWTGSVFVMDMKGENYLNTAGYRAKVMKQRVLRWAPFERVGQIWNPIMCIRANPLSPISSPEEEEDTRYLINLLFAPSGSKEDVFWENSAKNFLEGLALHVRTEKLTTTNLESNEPEDEYQVRERSMQEVRRLLTLGSKPFALLLGRMGQSRRTLIRQAGNTLARFTKGDGKTGNSILGMALEQTSVWAYERLRKVTYKPSGVDGDPEPAPNDFSFADLRDGNTTIYLIIPPDYMTEYRSVLRLMIGFAMREVRQSYVKSKRDPELKNKPPILFVLDEFQQLAYMRPIEEAMLYLAGYGARFWLFVQDLALLKKHYPDSWRTFFSNTGTQSFFGCSDIDIANLVSEMSGTATVDNRSYSAGVNQSDAYGESESTSSSHTSGSSSSSGPQGSTYGSNSSSTSGSTHGTSYTHTDGRSAGINVGFTSRRLITPDEVLRMHDEEQIVFMRGLSPIRCNKIPYYVNPEFKKRSEIPPPEEVDFE